ncbi:hypothetical protein Taro_025257 [Colocasia esculenta]|uniref:Uncharacterized protein n=1 Tax=Colocasia esculenta TaxID=4460 RepID=A0A843VMU5_COLES|nr:hypothetical protein [Colocasia esculenta]
MFDLVSNGGRMGWNIRGREVARAGHSCVRKTSAEEGEDEGGDGDGHEDGGSELESIRLDWIHSDTLRALNSLHSSQ